MFLFVFVKDIVLLNSKDSDNIIVCNLVLKPENDLVVSCNKNRELHITHNTEIQKHRVKTLIPHQPLTFS